MAIGAFYALDSSVQGHAHLLLPAFLFHKIELELFDFPPDAIGQDDVDHRNPAEKWRGQHESGHIGSLMINELHVRQGLGNPLTYDPKGTQKVQTILKRRVAKRRVDI